MVMIMCLTPYKMAKSRQQKTVASFNNLPIKPLTRKVEIYDYANKLSDTENEPFQKKAVIPSAIETFSTLSNTISTPYKIIFMYSNKIAVLWSSLFSLHCSQSILISATNAACFPFVCRVDLVIRQIAAVRR